MLLKETYLRVKNNMQVISSLLNLQAKGIADASVRAVFEDARNRVKTIALMVNVLTGQIHRRSRF